jgi:hypothetical protein
MDPTSTPAPRCGLALAPLAGIAVAAVCLAALACSGGGDPDGGDPPRPTMDEALDALECELVDTDELEGAAGSRDGVRCDIAGTWPARVRAELSARDHADLVGALAHRYDPVLNDVRCADGTAVSPVVVAGNGWIVLVSDGEGARRVRDELGGRVEPGLAAGPPISQATVPCTGDPWP